MQMQKKRFYKLNKTTHLTIMPGRRSKFSLTIFSSSSSLFLPVPYENTVIDRGSAMPIAYETCTRARRQSLAATRDLAIHLAAYAPERST